jgi:hypothetical protein
MRAHDETRAVPPQLLAALRFRLELATLAALVRADAAVARQLMA